MKIDLNSDLGESFGRYTIGNDKAVIEQISSANIACGFHAGDPSVIQKTVRLCRDRGVRIGAHPGFPDLMGFGRRNMTVSFDEAKAYMLYQLGALDAFCRANGVKLQHVKPHGALYNMAAKDEMLSKAICEAVREYDDSLIVLALANSVLYDTAKQMGLRAAAEVFADRAYEPDGALVSRSKPNAMITDEEEAIARVIRMVKTHEVTAVNGETIRIIPDSICVHGDGEKAILFVKKIR
ncbi:MAG: LamB/YcsF family protein, partial [Clostridia bacterium]|nr:LamB/YcsF family protein [Clostridia bacterium]